MTLREDDFAFLRRILKERSGLALSADKEYLLTTRLKPIIEDHRLKDLADLVARLREGRAGDLVDQVVDAMTTNESLFFRDLQPFEALTEMMLPKLLAGRPQRVIRIWSAAASTGQEPYSIAIMLEENAGRFGHCQIEILGTDLSRAALRRARMGEYTAFEVGRGMPPHYLQRYFHKTTRNHHVISPKVRARVKFECRNLLETFTDLGTFDIVFCRNVLIYFDRPTKTKVLERIAKVLSPDGFLVLGGPETTLGLTNLFMRHAAWRNVYERARDSDSGSLAIERVCA